MCDIPTISRLIIKAQLLFAGAIVFMVTAAARNANLLHAGDSPGLMVLALIGLGGAIAALVAAGRAAVGCAGPCASATAKLTVDINAAVAALTAIVISSALVVLIAGVAFIAQLAFSGILISLTVAGILFALIASDLAALSACAAAAAKPSPVVSVLGTLLLILVGTFVLASLGGAPIPFPPR